MRIVIATGSFLPGPGGPPNHASDLEKVPVGREPDTSKPRAIYLGKTFVPTPAGPDLVAKMELHARYLDQVSVTTGPAGVRRVGGVLQISLPRVRPSMLGGALFYALGPALAVAAAAGRRRCAIVCQSPFEGLGVVLAQRALPGRLRTRVQVELHGDWRTAARMYGSPARRIVGPLSDRMCEWTVRRADHVRVVSEVLGALARETGYEGPIDRYPTFSDYATFFDPPLTALPETPAVAFVGVLERYKSVDILLDAWQAVAAAVPGARLSIVGRGSMDAEVRRRVAQSAVGESIVLLDPMPRSDLVSLLDRSTCLVLPSRSEGLARVVLEAMARARPVVASDVGGIRELIDDGHNGRLVPSEDVVGLSEALIEVLLDRQLAEAMGRRARQAAEERNPRSEYESGLRRLARWISSE